MEKEVSRSIANFAAKFCNELGTNRTTLCSPLSAEIVLALLALGCKNQSREELLQALGIPDDDTIRTTFSFLNSTLKSIEGVTLNVANKIYVKQGGELKPGIKKDAEEVFQSSLEQLDFKDRQAAANTINKWVARETNDKIKDIVSPDFLNDRTRLVLVNAMYFQIHARSLAEKLLRENGEGIYTHATTAARLFSTPTGEQGSWAKPFPKSGTVDKPFHVNNTTTVLVPQMSMSNQTWNYGVSDELNAQLLQLKYEGADSSMIIVLPDEIEGLSSVLKKLAAGHNIMTDIENMRPRKYFDIVIPKFKVETTIDMKELLPKLGIKSIFKEADIDMLESNEPLFVSDAIQKALIVVDEKGTEAGVCMSMFVSKRSGRQRTGFKADRPFFYILTARQIPLFIGVYEGSEYAKAIPHDDNQTFNKNDDN